MLADGEAGYVWSEFGYCAAELVAESYGNGVVRDGMWLCGCEGGTTQVFVEVGSTDAYVGRGDLVLVSILFGSVLDGNGERKAVMYPDLSCAAFLFVHILNSDIFFAIVSCGSHVVGVLVPVLFLDPGVLSLSRLMTLFTNALSMADILFLYLTAECLRACRSLKSPTEIAGQVNHEKGHTMRLCGA